MILILLVGLYIYSLSKVEIQKISVTALQEISLSGFTLAGDVMLYNGGILPVGVDYIEYEVILEKSNNQLAIGRIDGKIIPPKQTIDFSISNKINWVPTLEVALSLITPAKTQAVIKGKIHLNIIDFKIPFETKVDLEPYIKQFVKKKFDETVDKIKAGLNKFFG